MNYTTRIAIRYIFSLKSFHFIGVITFISVLGIIIGVAVLICVMSIFNGFREFTENQLISFDPHIRIISSSGPFIENADSICTLIKNIPEVKYSTPVIQGKVIALRKNAMKVVTLNAVKSNEISTVSGITKNIIAGKFYLDGLFYDNGIVIGSIVSENLKILPEDSFQIITLPMLEQAVNTLTIYNGVNFKLSGIFQTYNNDYDGNYVYVSYKKGAELLKINMQQASYIDIRLNKLDDVSGVELKLKSMFTKQTVLSWYDLHKELYDVLQFERMSVFVVLSLIIIIAVFNVLASLAMTVTEKRQNIALLKSIGAESKSIRRIYLTEGMIIGFFSTIFGTLLGLGLCYGQLNFSWFKLSNEKYLVSALPVSIHLSDILLVALFSLILSFTATIYPARKASKIMVSESLRSE